MNKWAGTLFFLAILLSATFLLFWQVFLQNKIPFSANLLSSFFSPWSIEKFPDWETGIPNKPVGKDDLWIFYPQRTFSNTLLNNWEIPFWNPYSFSGNYHLGLSETAIFYPLNFLFLIFSQIDAWTFLIIIEPIIAGIGMYLFLKTTLSARPATLGALAFAFSGIVIVRSVEGLSVGHTLIWLPYVFWGIESFFKTKKLRFLWIILFSLSFSLLAGWFQFTFYIFIFSLGYTLLKLFFYKEKNIKRKYLILIPFFVFPLITLSHITPAVETLLEAPRVALEGKIFSYQHLMPIEHIFALFIPDFWGNPAVYNYFGKSPYKEAVLFIGVIPLILSFIAFLKQKVKEEWFFIASFLLSFLIAIDNPVSKLAVSPSIPLLSSFLPNRIFLISTFSFSVLAAFGFDFLIGEKKVDVFKIIKKAFFLTSLSVLILFLFITLPVIRDPDILNKVDRTGINTSFEAIRFKNSIIPMATFFVVWIAIYIFRDKYKSWLFFTAITSLLFFQSFLFGQKYIPFSQREFLYPPHPIFEFLKDHQGLDRFISIGKGHIVPSIPLQFGIFSPEGIGSMYIRRYGELVRYMKFEDFDIPEKIAIDLEINPNEFFQADNQRLYRFLELTGTKFIAVDKKSREGIKRIPQDKFSLIWENKNWEIYQYNNSMLRFFTTGSYKVISDNESLLRYLFSDEFNPNEVILEENPGFVPSNYQGEAKIINYSPNSISIDIKTENPTLFYLSDNYSNKFKVFIDGREGKILRANYTFRAVPIGKGNHRVEMIYNTDSFFSSLKIASITLAIFIILTLLAIKKYKFKF
ncbi:MAG: YfhO family protein [Candidatus Levybacteria bacterium]|nr:YfhO family protein [Candidatus Levybacteria bacterium]